MCDCYSHKCAHLSCTQMIPIHIADFAYERESFKAWCSTHIKEAEPGAIIFKMKPTPHFGMRRWRCAIKGPEVGNEGGNHPNTAQDWDEIPVKEA